MKNLLVRYLAFLSAFSLLLLLACNGQNKTNLSEERNLEASSASKVEESENTFERKEQFIDHLFFIEGQLCAWVRDIFEDTKGNLWFSTNHYDVMQYDGEKLRYFTEDHGLGAGRKTDIVEDEAGNIWFGTYRGLSKFDGKSFFTLTEEDGLIEDEIWSLLLDRKGEFWIGTMEGVSRFDGKNFTDFPLPRVSVKDTTTILTEERVNCIFEDKKGRIWFGRDGMGISIYDGEEFSHLSKADGLPDNNISHITQDSKGNIWISTMFGGISRYDGKTFTNFTQEGHIEGVEASGIFEDKTGNIWFSVENQGVYRYDGKSFTQFFKNAGLPTHGILCMLEDSKDRFWFGGWGGLFRYDADAEEGKSFAVVTKEGPWE